MFPFSGFATIHLATMYGHTETVAYLIARGQEVDTFDENGMTPLMHAAEKVKQYGNDSPPSHESHFEPHLLFFRRDPTQLLIR